MMKQISILFLALFWAHLAFTQPIVSIKGIKDSLTIEQRVMQYLDYLDIQENIHLYICFTPSMTYNMKGLTYALNQLSSDNYQVIRVRIDARLNNIELKQVLAHEMVHVKQFVTGELMMINNQQVLWRGKKYRCYRNPASSRSHPWEIEAHWIDNILVNLDKAPPKPPLATATEKPLGN